MYWLQTLNFCLHMCLCTTSCLKAHTLYAGPSGNTQAAYIIPPDTKVQTVVMADAIERSCSLAVTTDNETVIRGVMLFAEQVRNLP